jgi:gamma-glutamylcyclotransferase (GGCT)/AIG2-like uncharacterized protein YtfP
MKDYLFSYGTLQEDEVQLELFGRRLAGSKDVLKGYKTAPIEIRDELFDIQVGQQYLIAVPSTDENDTVDGTALEVSEAEILRADRYEPKEYRRVSVRLESGKRAWVYVAV